MILHHPYESFDPVVRFVEEAADDASVLAIKMTMYRTSGDRPFFTQRREITEDASALFNMLTGYSEPPDWKRLAVAPLDLQTRVIGLISRETERAQRGEPARIIAKMNSLVDPSTIRALYAASQAGVDIDLIVRGICCLRPGLPGSPIASAW